VSNLTITYIVAGACGAFGIGAYIAWVLVPAWTAYSRVWQRLAAAFLTLYVAAAFVGIGMLGGALVTYFWDRLAPA
jgi:hypothetical protein